MDVNKEKGEPLLSIDQLIFGRKSTYPKDFDPTRKIDKHKILHLLEYGRWAPTHKMTEPWHYVVFDSDHVADFYSELKRIYKKEILIKKHSLKKLARFDVRRNQVSHIIAICIKRDPKERIPEIEEISAVSCSAQNIYLGLQSLGIVGYWSTGLCFTKGMKDYLHLGDNDHCLGYFVLGYPKEKLTENSRERQPLNDHITWIDENINS